MINRLRAWFYRRIDGSPVTVLSVLRKRSEAASDRMDRAVDRIVQNSGPWTIDRIENELRGGFGSPRIPPVWWGQKDFDHDSVQLEADGDMRWYWGDGALGGVCEPSHGDQ